MNKAYEVMSTLFAPLNIKPRVFSTDYRNKHDNCFNNVLTMIPPQDISDEEIVSEFAHFYNTNGYSLDAVIELLNGVTEDSPEEELRKNIRPLYVSVKALEELKEEHMMRKMEGRE